MEGSLGPGSAISEITAVSVDSFLEAPQWGLHSDGSGQRWRSEGYRRCQEACGFNVGTCLPSLSRILRLLSGQEVHNFQLTPRPSDSEAGRPTLLAFEGSQDSPENELELGLRVDGETPSMNHTSSCSSSMINGSLPRERLMHQALEDLPQGVDPARKEVGTRSNCWKTPQDPAP